MHLHLHTKSFYRCGSKKAARWRLEPENDPEEGTSVEVVAMGGAGNGSRQNLEGKPNRDKYNAVAIDQEKIFANRRSHAGLVCGIYIEKILTIQ